MPWALTSGPRASPHGSEHKVTVCLQLFGYELLAKRREAQSARCCKEPLCSRSGQCELADQLPTSSPACGQLPEPPLAMQRNRVVRQLKPVAAIVSQELEGQTYNSKFEV